MPLPSVTYSTYSEHGGKLEEGAFEASLRAAVSAVRDIIGFNEPQDTGDEDAYIRAVCAAVDVDAAYGASGGIGEGLGSFTLGSFSASQGQTSSYDIDMTRAIRRELIGSGLLYAGVR